MGLSHGWLYPTRSFDWGCPKGRAALKCCSSSVHVVPACKNMWKVVPLSTVYPAAGAGRWNRASRRRSRRERPTSCSLTTAADRLVCYIAQRLHGQQRGQQQQHAPEAAAES